MFLAVDDLYQVTCVRMYGIQRHYGVAPRWTLDSFPCFLWVWAAGRNQGALWSCVAKFLKRFVMA